MFLFLALNICFIAENGHLTIPKSIGFISSKWYGSSRPYVFWKKDRKIHMKTHVLEPLFNKVAHLKAWNLTKK